jgi:protein SCO1/2
MMNKGGRLQQALILLPILVIIASAIYIFRLTDNSHFHNDRELPTIQGFVLKEAQQLTNIQLTDHQGMPVNRDYFLGKWRFIAYGYTQCPDICPTTLLTLTQFADLLSESHENLDPQLVFYTVDPYRDSQKILAQYIHYFSEKFVAVRANNSADARSFQQSLGIKVEITRSDINEADENVIKSKHPQTAPKNDLFYQVSHGLAIFLINPDAELQAVFLPEITELGIKSFTPKMLYHDYLKVINYYQQGS